MIKPLVTFGAAGASIALFAACTPPLPPDVLAARLERTITCIPGQQQVAVSTELAQTVNEVNVAISGLCPDQSMVAVPADSPDATVRILDRPATPADVQQMAQQCASDVLTAPVLGSPIGMVVNIVGVEGIVLTPQAVAGLLNGTITRWSDPLITEANSGFDLPDIPVTLLRLDVPSGAVEAMTAWLAKEVPDVWTQGQISTLTVGTPVASYTAMVSEMTGEEPIEEGLNADLDFDALLDDFSDDGGNGNGFDDEDFFDDPLNEDFLDDIDLDADIDFDDAPGEGAIAVMPVFLANQNVLPVADLPVDEFPISVTNVDLPKVGIAAMEITTADDGDLFPTHAVGGIPIEGQFDQASAKVVLEEGTPLAGWPVMAVSSILACDSPSNPLPTSTAQFFLRLAGQGTFDSVGLTPLPEPVRIQALPALRVELDALEDDIDLDTELVDQSEADDSADES